MTAPDTASRPRPLARPRLCRATGGLAAAVLLAAAAPAPGDLIVTGRPAAACAPAGTPGLDLACLNRQLQAASGAPAPSADGDATSDAQTLSKVGTFSQTATAQRLGKNFGHSAQPYRPPPPVYSHPIMTGAPR